MKTAERPDVATETTEHTSTVLQGEELDTVLALAARACQYDLGNARQLKRARDLALHVKRTGHLPGELPA